MSATTSPSASGTRASQPRENQASVSPVRLAARSGGRPATGSGAANRTSHDGSKRCNANGWIWPSASATPRHVNEESGPAATRTRSAAMPRSASATSTVSRACACIPTPSARYATVQVSPASAARRASARAPAHTATPSATVSGTVTSGSRMNTLPTANGCVENGASNWVP